MSRYNSIAHARANIVEEAKTAIRIAFLVGRWCLPCMAPDSRRKMQFSIVKHMVLEISKHRPSPKDRSGIAQGSLGDPDFVARASLAEDKRRYNYLLGVVE